MYGELIVGVNMLFNYAILSFANKVGNVQAARGRLLFASFAGALPVVIFPSSASVVVLSFICMTVMRFWKGFRTVEKVCDNGFDRSGICWWFINGFSISHPYVQFIVYSSCLCSCRIRLSLFHEKKVA